ncbi:MAG TPA: hypothetical protein VMY76_10535 [Gemmatimonadales bacterium]|nr:hypothetical protein [Gemmatimonadales bacterium]
MLAPLSRLGTVVLGLAGSTLVTGIAPSLAPAQAPADAAAPANLSPELLKVRATLDKYRDPIVAVHDGYLSSVGCVEYTKGTEGTMHYAAGGMGVHFLNLQLIGKPLDPAKPQVLIYEPEGDRLRLAAAEWFVPTEAAGQTRPTILGQELQGPMEGHDPLQPKGMHHYDLHVWLWQHNPAGTFAPTNPDVTCPKQAYSFTERAPKLVNHQAR